MAADQDKDKNGKKETQEALFSPTFSQFTEGITLSRDPSNNSKDSQSNTNSSHVSTTGSGTPEVSPHDPPQQRLMQSQDPPAASMDQRTPSPPNREESESKSSQDSNSQGQQQPSGIDVSQRLALRNDNSFQVLQSPMDPQASGPPPPTKSFTATTPQITSVNSKQSLFHQISLGSSAHDDNDHHDDHHDDHLDTVTEEKLNAHEDDNDNDNDNDDDEDDIMDDSLLRAQLSRFSGSGKKGGGRRATLNISDMPTHKQQKKDRSSSRERKPGGLTPISGRISAGTDASPIDAALGNINTTNKNGENDKPFNKGRHSRKHSRKKSLVEKGSLRDLHSNRSRHSRHGSRSSRGSRGSRGSRSSRRGSRHGSNLGDDMALLAARAAAEAAVGDDNFADYQSFDDAESYNSDYFDDEPSSHSGSGDMGSGVIFVRRKTASFSSHPADDFDLDLIRRPSMSSQHSFGSSGAADDNFHFRQASSVNATQLFADLDLKDFYSSIPDTYDERERLERERLEKANRRETPIKRRHSLLASFKVTSETSDGGDSKEEEQAQSPQPEDKIPPIDERQNEKPKKDGDTPAIEEGGEQATLQINDTTTEDDVDNDHDSSDGDKNDKNDNDIPEEAVTKPPDDELETEPAAGAGAIPLERLRSNDSQSNLAPPETHDRHSSSDQLRSLMTPTVAQKLWKARNDTIAEGDEHEEDESDIDRLADENENDRPIGKRDSNEFQDDELELEEERPILATDNSLDAPVSHVKARPSSDFLELSIDGEPKNNQPTDFRHQWDLPPGYDFASVPDVPQGRQVDEKLPQGQRRRSSHSDSGSGKRGSTEELPHGRPGAQDAYGKTCFVLSSVG